MKHAALSGVIAMAMIVAAQFVMYGGEATALLNRWSTLGMLVTTGLSVALGSGVGSYIGRKSSRDAEFLTIVLTTAVFTGTTCVVLSIIQDVAEHRTVMSPSEAVQPFLITAAIGAASSMLASLVLR